MSALLARIMLAIFMLPAAAILYTITLVVVNDLDSGRWPVRRPEWLAALLASWVFIAAYWTLLWRKAVRWTEARKRSTVFAALLSAVAGALAGWATSGVDDEFGFFVFSVVAPLLWLPATVFVWRESPAERATRVAGREAITCPNCGYNLTGLSAARCPECGTGYTLDELLARQPCAHAAEVEDADTSG